MKFVFCFCFSLLFFTAGFPEARIEVDPSVRYQTISGWEATAQAGQFHPAFPQYKNELFDRVVNELGVNRLRVGLTSSVENPVDFFDPNVDSEQHFEIVNDNADPFRINPAGFHFARLDHKIRTVVLPMARRLRAKREKLFINITYEDFGPSAFKHRDHPEEYAEFVLATYLHLKKKYKLIPDVWEVILEPDNASWDAEQIADCIMAAAKRLKKHGFTPRFILPSTANMATSLSYFERIVKTPGILPFVYELCYHRYAGVSSKTLRQIASQGKKFGVRTAMLEHIGSGYEDLHRDLKTGNVSSWQQYTLAFPGMVETGAKYYLLNVNNIQSPVVIIASRTNFLRQYFHYIRQGAVRILATTTTQKFNPVAFINRNGKYVVVVKVSNGGSFSVSGLPAGTFGIRYTTSSRVDVPLPDVSTRSGHVSTAIPTRGVITVYQK